MAENSQPESTGNLPPSEQPQELQRSPQTVGETSTLPGMPFRLWNPPTGMSTSALLIPTDLEPTAAEVAAAYQDQSRRAERLQNPPLMTQQMRDRQQAARLKKWPNCTIRVRFHNQMQLEKSFPSTSKIKAVYAFVRECLNDETKPIKFVLYQPPARELKVSDATVRDKTLLELQLTPASVLLLRFLSDELNDREKLPPLQQGILAAAEDLPVLAHSTEDLAEQPRVTAPQDPKAVQQKLTKFLKLSSNR
ncbi:hypothetical protein FRC08_012181 [Ceratobasidium sp. 394]|nr:hypothetical protein FRC08_012181 [Ceratobasidium sp. 394]KAG9075627.1 hypothetical protein FS749_012686 [Ceratobasidium sp. UAMH 11750]